MPNNILQSCDACQNCTRGNEEAIRNIVKNEGESKEESDPTVYGIIRRFILQLKRVDVDKYEIIGFRAVQAQENVEVGSQPG